MSPLVVEMLEWADRFEAGALTDPAVLDGTLEPGERLGLCHGPLTKVEFVVPDPELAIASTGPSGLLIATDQRMILQRDDGGSTQWRWAGDVSGVTPVRNGLGVMWKPGDDVEGPRLHGLVVPAFARGEITAAQGSRTLLPLFVRVAVTWRASQPGGLAAWRDEFTARYGRP